LLQSFFVSAGQRGDFDVSLLPMSTDLSSISISASALTAQTTQVETIANNIANAQTPDYTAKQAQFVPMNPGVTVGAIVDTGHQVDLGTEMINLINAKAAYQAAAFALQRATADDKVLITSV
jgi:flagellar basal body rod protein FlgG